MGISSFLCQVAGFLARAWRVAMVWLADWLAGLLLVTRSDQKKPTSEDVGW